VKLSDLSESPILILFGGAGKYGDADPSFGIGGLNPISQVPGETFKV